MAEGPQFIVLNPAQAHALGQAIANGIVPAAQPALPAPSPSRVRKIPVFEETGDATAWATWISQFETIAAIKGWNSMRMKAELKLGMSGPGALLTRDINIANPRKYDQVKADYQKTSGFLIGPASGGLGFIGSGSNVGTEFSCHFFKQTGHILRQCAILDQARTTQPPETPYMRRKIVIFLSAGLQICANFGAISAIAKKQSMRKIDVCVNARVKFAQILYQKSKLIRLIFLCKFNACVDACVKIPRFFVQFVHIRQNAHF